MNYAAIKKTDVANGPGIRVSLFVSGCTHGCRGCFNSEAWDFMYGQEFTRETEAEILQALEPAYIRGFSVLGGEPMEPENRGTVLALLEKVRRYYPGKDIWCYTGYEYEKDLLRWAAEEKEQGAQKAAQAGHEPAEAGKPAEEKTGEAKPGEGPAHVAKSPEGSAQGQVARLLSLIDVLVDGEFVEEKKNLRLAFRGSENQRLIDLKESRRQGRTVEYVPGPDKTELSLCRKVQDFAVKGENIPKG